MIAAKQGEEDCVAFGWKLILNQAMRKLTASNMQTLLKQIAAVKGK